MAFVALLIAFGASIIGGICGIGGGILIKPLLDLISFAGVTTISFFSSCTVLAMSACNVSMGLFCKSNGIDKRAGTALALGAAIGGILGNQILSYILRLVGNDGAVGAAQSITLLLLVLGTLVYTLKKKFIKTLNVDKLSPCVAIGLSLGTISSFLGIGGGPFNLVVLHYFLGYDTKKAVSNSLYIILLSQIANLLLTLIQASVPQFEPASLILMGIGGVAGGIVGKLLGKKLNGEITDRLFIALMTVIICICFYNTIGYLNLGAA